VVHPHDEHLRPARLAEERALPKYRLKLRDNDEVRQSFAVEVEEKARAVGLTVPEWIPVWDRLPEEAQIPG